MTKEEILQEFSDINYVYNNCTRYDTLRLMLNELTEPRTGHWIPLNERLPEENETVIVSTKHDVYPEARYTKEYGWECIYEPSADYWVKLEDVTAWMPLPKPYKPQESENKE